MKRCQDPIPASLRQSLAARIVEQAQRKFLPVTTSILLPHGLAFVMAALLIKRHRNRKADYFPETSEDRPRSLSYIASRVGHMWIIHALSVFVFAVSAPSAASGLVCFAEVLLQSALKKGNFKPIIFFSMIILF